MKKTRPKTPEPLPEEQWQGSFLVDAQMLQQEQWLTTADVMSLFNVSRTTIYRLKAAHKLPAFKLGGTVVYPKSLINKILLLRSCNQFKE